jgi:putative acetyltransferase
LSVKDDMGLQESVSPLSPQDFPRVVEVWEASVRATHLFFREADIQFFKPLLRDALYQVMELACVRDEKNQVVGIVGVVEGKVEMLFIRPILKVYFFSPTVRSGVSYQLVRPRIKFL